MHFLVHIPRFLARFVMSSSKLVNVTYIHIYIYTYNRIGPLVRQWTMRFEAKHQYLKSLATRMGNYINVCYSLAVRHQSYLCYILSSSCGICVTQKDIGKGSYIHTGAHKCHKAPVCSIYMLLIHIIGICHIHICTYIHEL